MIQKLSSLKLTFYNLVAMVFLLGTGVVLSRVYPQVFDAMNRILVVEWLRTAWSRTPVPALWFVLLCLSAGILFVNAVCCTLTRQIQAARRSGRLEKWLFFVLHCLFVLVLACHGLILIAGHKQSKLSFFPGDEIGFKDRYRVVVSEVVFTDEVRILKMKKKEQRAFMTRENIHPKMNFARVSLYQDSRLVENKRVIMLSPLRYGTIQVTVTRFIVDPDDGRIGVKLTITDNPLNVVFFVIYGLMILCLGLYIPLSAE
jgi:hypothetical protein